MLLYFKYGFTIIYLLWKGWFAGQNKFYNTRSFTESVSFRNALGWGFGSYNDVRIKMKGALLNDENV